MLYSLARFRFEKPTAPFELGGEYLGRRDQHWLRDALGSVELEGPPEMFQGLSDGDLVVVQVDKANEFTVIGKSLRVEFKTQLPAAVAPKPHAARFTTFVSRVRDFFIERGLNEVFTPTLVTCPGLEPSLEPFATQANFGRHRATVYLPTSPEVSLKKAIAQGWTDIFEIKNCFRRGEAGAHHEHEFLMLEWYRSFADLRLIETDLRALITKLAQEGWIDQKIAVTETDFRSLFKTYFDFDLRPDTTATQLRKLCDDLSVHVTEDDTFNDLFHRLLVDRLEAEIAKLGPLILKRFPPSQAALAKLDSEGWADRFEFYWRGLEIANAFNEVSDPEEQQRRWEGEARERARLGSSAVPSDPALIRALRRGMPSCGGIALGVDRLYMACARVDDIRELRLFKGEDLFSGTYP